MGLFGKRREKGPNRCCGNGGTPENLPRMETEKAAGSIKVLGGGCAKSHALEEAVGAALEALEMNASVELVTDFAQIAACGVMTTPALVVDGKVVSCGKVLSRDDVVKLLREVRG